MKNIALLLLSALVFFGCQKAEEKPDTLPLKVAKAYGVDQWDQVKNIEYTWNVRRDSATVISRNWKWNVADRMVNYSDADTSYSYSLDMPADSLPEADRGFINDKYWFMMPFQLAWDEGYTFETEENASSPLKGTNSTKLTIIYNSADGYTPGDAYDLYLDENNMILEWTFRRGNGDQGATWTWENVQDFGPIKLALDHMNAEGERFIWFTDVKVN
ncbi:hypothetical protein [Algoriphagus hitonicola]|uniref:Lipoprotein n=1 Tax=Algoriphagus hitonicola TaxID=435880 RepID=A0A1I2PX53_9BACT|nr:hypothetical protein [Algoriphagus hitonicola]SFG20200.1 hypothetical protein SAMN04487988_10210 [Algoriphagus hitonicola]